MTSRELNSLQSCMAEHIEPYNFEPQRTTDEPGPRQQRDNYDERHEQELEPRIGHNRWCTCQNCPAMTTAKESVCCREIWEALDKMESQRCITAHRRFEWVCLDEEVLQTSLVAMHDVRFDRYTLPIPEKTFRLAAYRQFTWWIHSRLGKSIRRVIPACVVKQIREKFPDKSGQYAGYQDADTD